MAVLIEPAKCPTLPTKAAFGIMLEIPKNNKIKQTIIKTAIRKTCPFSKKGAIIAIFVKNEFRCNELGR